MKKNMKTNFNTVVLTPQSIAASQEACEFIARAQRKLGARCIQTSFDVSYETASGEAQIDNLAVSASARRRGIGRALLHRALHWALDKRAAPKVALVTTEDNVNAQALYESNGFALAADGLHLRLQV
jgi:ribosomal protein S18 acetylase RimI-like enzyme